MAVEVAWAPRRVLEAGMEADVADVASEVAEVADVAELAEEVASRKVAEVPQVASRIVAWKSKLGMAVEGAHLREACNHGLASEEEVAALAPTAMALQLASCTRCFAMASWPPCRSPRSPLSPLSPLSSLSALRSPASPHVVIPLRSLVGISPPL